MTQEISSQNLTSDQKRDLCEFFARNCSFDVNFDSNTTFIVVHNGREIVFSFYYIKGSRKNITFLEIYSVCTLIAARKQGIAKAALREFIAEKYYDNTIWLGVLPEKKAPYKLYTSLGFTHPRLTDKSPLGLAQPFRFISLIYNPFAGEEEKALATAECAHITQDVENLRENRAPLSLSYKIFEQSLGNLLRESVEIGGALALEPDHSLVIDTVYRGSEGTLAVNMPHAPFVYHTHPLHAYKITAHGIGTPSGPDFVFSTNPLVSAHLVIALEGSYVIQYSSDFRVLCSFLSVFKPECYELLQQSVYDFFKEEYFRPMHYVISGDKAKQVPFALISISEEFRGRVYSIIRDYLKAVNETTLKTLIRESNDASLTKCISDFTDLQNAKICRVVFIPRREIERHIASHTNIIVKDIKV